jgi:cytochrome b561
LALRNIPVSFFGLFDLPVLSVDSSSFLFSFAGMHGDLANIIGILALGHVAAALYHHIVLKDAVLERMRPSRSV